MPNVAAGRAVRMQRMRTEVGGGWEEKERTDGYRSECE